MPGVLCCGVHELHWERSQRLQSALWLHQLQRYIFSVSIWPPPWHSPYYISRLMLPCLFHTLKRVPRQLHPKYPKRQNNLAQWLHDLKWLKSKVDHKILNLQCCRKPFTEDGSRTATTGHKGPCILHLKKQYLLNMALFSNGFLYSTPSQIASL